MSKLEQLINELCPNGVEFMKLGDFCEIKTGKGITKSDAALGGTFPIISGGQSPMGYYHISNRGANTVTISRVGAYAGFVSYIKEQFYLNDKCFSVIPIAEKLSTSFLYYVLKGMECKIKELQSEGGVPTINTTKVSNLEIPLPPLPVQEEIVRILDAFTSHAAELQAELQARREQYEYYRDKLLSFEGDSSVEWKKLGDVCKVLRGKRLTTRQLSDNERFPVYHGGIDPIGYYSTNNRNANSTMVINVGASAGTVGFSRNEFWSSDGCFCFTHVDIIEQRYLFFVLQSMEPSIKSKVRKAGIPTLDNKDVERIVIPIPPLSEQKRIVAILDKFEALVNDLTEGLPAEIAARQEQYEYYRDKLLSFPKAV